MSDEHSADQRWRSATQLVLFLLCYNYRASKWRYRLGVRTEDSQSSNPGSIPGSATIQSPLQRNLTKSPTKRKKLPVFCYRLYETLSGENAPGVTTMHSTARFLQAPRRDPTFVNLVGDHKAKA